MRGGEGGGGGGGGGGEGIFYQEYLEGDILIQ
jgi:hypothetical protein